ncbi:MAG TPA: type II secretion system protein [Patescibacteria group bacterium]|nr:type II secretion system protein [Patescibacteria group bacterium]
MLLGRKIKAKEGFTLIEIMVALAILLFVVIMAVSFFPLGLKSAISSSQQTVAIYLAQAKIEEIISAPYAELSAGETVEANLSSIDQDFVSFSRTTNLDYVDSNLNDSAIDLGLIRARVQVFWTDSQLGATASTSLITLIANL